METFQKFAHESGDGITITHCPMCGSGQVIGRSDGLVECGFCNSAFLVRVQPMMSAFPQSINGMPVQIPGMPAPMPGPGMPGAGMPGQDGSFPPGQDGDEDEDGEGAPFGNDATDASPEGAPPNASEGGPSGGSDSDDDKDEDSGPPKKKSSYRAGGRAVSEAAYLAYLARLVSQP